MTGRCFSLIRKMSEQQLELLGLGQDRNLCREYDKDWRQMMCRAWLSWHGVKASGKLPMVVVAGRVGHLCVPCHPGCALFPPFLSFSCQLMGNGLEGPL